jgi:hypothetical protein
MVYSADSCRVRQPLSLAKLISADSDLFFGGLECPLSGVKQTSRLKCPLRPKADIMQLSTLGYAQLLICGSSCRTTFSNELWISILPL